MRVGLNPVILCFLLLAAAAGCSATEAGPDPLLKVDRTDIEWVEISHMGNRKRLPHELHGDLMHKLADAYNKAGRESAENRDHLPGPVSVTVSIRNAGVVTLTPISEEGVAAVIRGQRVWLQSARLRYIINELGRAAFQ